MFTHVLRRAAATLAATFIATLIAACGGNDYNAADPAGPSIATFTATPAAQPFGGGQVVLSWNAPYATTLVIDNGVGDVSGLSSKAVNVAANTTFTLTASNAAGTASATTAVTVALQPAPTIGSFTATPASLPVGGGSVTLSWATTNATTLSIDNGVGAVTGTSKVVSVAANTTFTLTATNAAGAVNKTASVAVAVTASSNLFIDAALGADTNPCTQALPCKTMTKALSVVPAASIFSLADGVYDTTTQGNAFRLPTSATLRAINPGGATVKGLAINIADGNGSVTIDGLVLDLDPITTECSSINAQGFSQPPPTLTLTGVLMKCVAVEHSSQIRGGLNIGGNVKATMMPGALAGGLYTAGLPDGFLPLINLSASAELLITGGVIDGNNLGQSTGGGLLVVTENSRLTLDGVTVRNRTQTVISAQRIGTGQDLFIPTIVLRNGTLIDNVGAATRCEDGAAIVMGHNNGSLTMDRATLSNTAGVGICVGNGNGASASVNLIQSTITRAGTAAISSALGGGTLTVDGSSLTNNHYGILWVNSRGGPSFDLRNTTITGDGIAGGIGVSLSLGSGTLKMRGSTVSNNADSGVRLQGTMTTDLGKAGDPGGNSFTGTGLTGLRDIVDPGQFVDAVGNTWKPNQQGANANGYYSVPPLFAPVPQMGPASGTNFIISGTTTLNL